jgi:RHS repeat-associated protein
LAATPANQSPHSISAAATAAAGAQAAATSCPPARCARFLPLVVRDRSAQQPSPPSDPSNPTPPVDPNPPAASDTQPPSPPLNLRATAKSAMSASLAWDAASDDVGVIGYVVEFGAARAITTSATLLTVGDLTPSTAYSFTVVAYDAAGNRSAASVPLSLTTNAPEPAYDLDPPSPPRNLRVVAKTHGTIALAWDASADNVGVAQYDVIANDSWVGASATPEISVTGLLAGTEYQFYVYAHDASENYSDISNQVAVATDLPPAPDAIAPAVDETVASDIAGDTAFLYSGADPIQVGVAPGTIDPLRVAILRGHVIDRAGAPLAGVRISVAGHPEYGSTTTRADGMFDLAANGGAPLTLDYERSGYLPAQRQAVAPLRGYAWLPEVALVALDPQVTAVALGDTVALQVAAGGVVSDTDGVRQAVLMFPAGTRASLVSDAGSERPLDELHIRATEYTVGAHGPAAMPGPLPDNSGYTYAVEYSADEAIEYHASEVRFSQPVISYVENFLHFPVGIAVPAGYYDRQRSAWVASDSGRVIAVVGASGGLAEIDGDGDGLADDPAALGMGDAELAALAARYPVGQQLWRVAIPHLTPWDYNWPFAPPADAIAPNGGQPHADKPEDNPCTRAGSIIECQNQTLGEALDVVGTPYQLRYTSERAPGHAASSALRIPLSGATIPPSLKRIELDVEIAGRLIHETYSSAAYQDMLLAWDRRDAYGRLVQGWQDVVAKIGFVYDGIYQRTERFGYNGNGIAIDGNRTRQEVTLQQTWHDKIGVFDLASRRLGGWSIDAQHTYDPVGKVVYLGTGGRQSGEFVGSVVTQMVPGHMPMGITVGPDGKAYYADRVTDAVYRLDPDRNDPFWPYSPAVVAGLGGSTGGGYNGDNQPATAARLSEPTDVAFDPSGYLYIADRHNHRVRRVDPRGVITTFAGNGTCPLAPFPDGALAAETPVCTPTAVAAAADGTVYILSRDLSAVYRVGADQRITRIAGGNGSGLRGDGGPATAAQLYYPSDIAIGPNGSLYIADTYNHRVRRISRTGTITTVVGSGPNGNFNGQSAGDGGPATAARLNMPTAIDAQPDGSFYITEHYRVRWVSPEGIISSVIGNAGASGVFLDQGQPLGKLRVTNLGGVAVAPDGEMYLAAQYESTSVRPNARILRVRPALPGFTTRDIALPSADGQQLYQFNAVGRHLRTLDTLTGVPLYSFGYDARGRLTSIADRDGLITRIERDLDGTATAIVGPYGQRTALAIDADNHLASVTDPAGATTQLGYQDDGLLTSLTDPRGGVHSFEYDELGRLIKDTDPVGGFTALDRADRSHGYTVQISNALGDTSSVSVQDLPGGAQHNTSVAASGATAQSDVEPSGQISVDARGNTTTVVQSPDPRWGMQAPFVASIGVRTPDGQLAFTQTASHQVTLADPSEPLSVLSQVDTVTINGRTTTTAYSAAAHTITTTDPAGLRTVRTLDARGRTVREETTNLAPKIYAYDTLGRLVKVTEGIGAGARSTALAYDQAGLLASSTDPLGAITSFQYDAAGRVTRETLPTGQVLAFDYDAAGNRVSATDAQGCLTSYEYDLQNRLTAVVRDPGGRAVRTEYRYDVAGNLVRQVDDAGAGRLNITTQYSYTPVGADGYAVGRVTDALGQTTTLSYTAQGDLQSATDPLGRTTTLSYTALGRLVEVTTPGGRTTRTEYDAEGRPVRTIDPRGGTTLASYDALGRLSSTTAGAAAVGGQPALDVTTSYAYDVNGRVVGVTDALGHTTARTYDEFGRPASTSDPLGTITSFGYDAMDRLIETSVDGGDGAPARVTSYEYDLAGRPLSVHVDPRGLNLTTRYLYAHAGSADTWSLQELIDPNGNHTAFDYNSLGQRDQTIDALGQISSFGYDNLGRMIQQTDPLGHATGYTYDALGRVISLTEDGRSETWAYGADGTLASATDFAGRTTSFSYDADERGVGIDYPAGTADVAYTRDEAGNITAMADGLGTTEYAYDALGRLVGRTRDGRTVGYSYDALGRTGQIDYWGQGTVDYSYDSGGRIASLTPWGADPTTYSYRGTGELIGQAHPNGVSTSYDYDSAGRLIGMLHAAGATNLEQIVYALDANGNRTQIDDGDGTTHFQYDALNRLTGASYPAIPGGPAAASLPYTYDAGGNRTGDGVSSYNYDAANRVTNPAYSYDANGNLLSDGSATYEYDAANRLVKSVAGGHTSTYAYDGNGNLVRATGDGVTSDLVIDERGPLPTVLGEIRSDGAEIRYAYGPGGVAAQQVISATQQAISYPLLDALGSLRRLTDAGGATTLRQSFDAFGVTRHASGTGWTTLGFAGERANPADGTVYLRARHYRPALGRFLQRDSYAGDAGRPQSLNRYAYAENNPATWTDPSGRCVGFLFGSATCRPIWETGQGINVADGKAYWWGVAKAGVGLIGAPVEIAEGLIKHPAQTLRGMIIAPFQTVRDVLRALKCDDMDMLGSSLVNFGALAIGAAEGLERMSASAVEDGSHSTNIIEEQGVNEVYSSKPLIENSDPQVTIKDSVSIFSSEISLGDISINIGHDATLLNSSINVSNISNLDIPDNIARISFGNININIGERVTLVNSSINISCAWNNVCNSAPLDVVYGSINITTGSGSTLINSGITVADIGHLVMYRTENNILKHAFVNINIGDNSSVINSPINVKNIFSTTIVS